MVGKIAVRQPEQFRLSKIRPDGLVCQGTDPDTGLHYIQVFSQLYAEAHNDTQHRQLDEALNSLFHPG